MVRVYVITRDYDLNNGSYVRIPANTIFVEDYLGLVPQGSDRQPVNLAINPSGSVDFIPQDRIDAVKSAGCVREANIRMGRIELILAAINKINQTKASLTKSVKGIQGSLGIA